ncbi:Serine-type D-Ala-D-Ala carboxypeptidase, partial [mine drainage metagenome]
LIRDFPQYRFIFKIKKFTWDHITQRNRVSLLWTDPYVKGMKTGYTKAAGYCMLIYADRKGMGLISVVLKTPSWDARVNDSQALITYGYNFFKNERVATAGTIVSKPRVYESAAGYAPVGPAHSVVLTVTRGHHALKTRIVWNHWPLTAPLAAGADVGTLLVTNSAGQRVDSVPLVTLAPVPEGGLFTRLSDEL